MFGHLFTPTHLIVLSLLTVLVFGPKRLPELAASLGKSIRTFKHSIQDSDKTSD